MKSILQSSKKCYLCGCTNNLNLHHIFFGARRKLADEDGLTVYLCIYHHTGSNQAVHMNRSMDLKLKQEAQKAYEKTHTREEFIQRYRRNYLD